MATWIQAIHKLPTIPEGSIHTEELFLNVNGDKEIGKLWRVDGDEYFMTDTLRLLRPKNYYMVKWYDESTPTTTVGGSAIEAAKKYAATGWKQVETLEQHYDEKEYNAFLAGAAHAQQSQLSLKDERAEDAQDFKLLEEYNMEDRLEKTITHCLTKVPEENRKIFIINLCNGMIGSAILHFNNRYVKKLIVPDFKTTFK